MNEDVEEGPIGTDRWAEALTWHVTLREAADEDLTGAVGREWHKWHADRENQRIFDDVSRLIAGRDLYRTRGRPTRAELEADRYDVSIPIAEWRKTAPPRMAQRQGAFRDYWWRRLAGGFAVAALAVVAVLVMRLPLRFWLGAGVSGRVVYQTNVGELRNIDLLDGSTLVLGGRTKITVAFSAKRRWVDLTKGQAWFKVAHHERWPFIVDAGDGTITDVGTAFVVTRDSDRVVVAVTEGMVEVAAGSAPGRTLRIAQRAALRPALVPIRITRGEELAVSDNGALSAVKQTDTHAATAWTHGRLTFDDVPLRYVVESLDRYSSRHIAVSASAGALRFSGIVFDDEIDDWLQGLDKIFPVTIEEREAVVCVRTRDYTASHEPSDASCTKRQ